MKIRNNEDLWSHVSSYLKILPDVLITKIFAMLQTSCPNYLAHEIIVSYFLRGNSVTLRKELPGVKQRTIQDIARVNSSVRELELTDFYDISDQVFANLLRKLPNLNTLILRGCSKVGAETAHSIAEVSPGLEVLNLSNTSVTSASLATIVLVRPHLKVLKLAGIKNWTDATISNFLAALPNDFQLPALHTLKLRQNSLSDASLGPILGLCPALKRLDLSFTLVRHPPQLMADSHFHILQKLCLTSTAVSSSDIVETIKLLPELRTLALGVLGSTGGPGTFMGNSSAMTMTDAVLASLTTVLEHFQYIENINLVGNTKLGQSSKDNTALSEFITKIGRRCKKLNLSGIHNLRSFHLAGLVPTEDHKASLLETFILNNTGIDDEASLYLSTCFSLRSLSVAGTKLTSEGVLPIIDSCSKLENLDLTSCRGIRVVDRRRFFEVWKEVRC